MEKVLEIIFTNLQVHTTRFVTFTTRKPSDIQVMMLPVRSHANAKLIQLARCKFKVSWMKFVGTRPTQIHYQLKKIFDYVKDLFYGSHSRKFLAPAVNFVIFMTQRPPANIVLLKWRAKFTRTLSNSPKC